MLPATRLFEGCLPTLQFTHAADCLQEKEAEKDGESALDVRKRKRLERDPLHQGLIVERSQLKGREYQIDLAARLGKTQVREERRCGGAQECLVTPVLL